MAQVLVVDDEADIRELVRINLELDGHAVDVAVDGKDALRRLREAPPDIVILDVMMPGMDGWQVLTEVKSDPDPALSGVPVIMLTARSDDVDRIRGGIEGAVRYITKPFSLSDLRREVHEALGGEPESVQRRRAQNEALEHLARMERGAAADQGVMARPRLTRLDRPVDIRPQPAAPSPIGKEAVASLSDKQRELLTAVGTAPTVRAAATELGVSRSNVYASLRRIARKLGVSSVPTLVELARQGAVPNPD